jgi:hypothetical protein
MKKVLIAFFLLTFGGFAGVAQKLAKEDMAKLTQEQRMVYENSRKRKVNRKSHDSLKKKVKREKKLDRASRRIKAPKKPHTSKKR